MKRIDLVEVARWGVATLLAVAGILKVAWVPEEFGWLSRPNYYAAAVFELCVSAAILGTRWSGWTLVALVFAGVGVIASLWHVHETEPCNCMGALPMEAWMRTLYLSALGAMSCVVLGSRPNGGWRMRKQE